MADGAAALGSRITADRCCRLEQRSSAVYWANSPIYIGGPAADTTGSGASDGSLIGKFITDLGGSPYFNINHSYTDGGGLAIANSVTYDKFWANSTFNVPANGANVTDANMVAMLSVRDSTTVSWTTSDDPLRDFYGRHGELGRRFRHAVLRLPLPRQP